MSEKPKIKIFISSHKPTDYIKNEIFQPVQVGCALKELRIPDFDYDNDGDNISEKNPRFCELTAQYWAWKNADADYYGFFHYRRYLAFGAPKNAVPDIWGSIVETNLDEQTLSKHGISEAVIEKLVPQYDIILPIRRNVKTMPKSGRNIREQYLASGFLHESDLDIMLDVIREKYPDFLPYAEAYIKGKKTYLNNMFIMRKDIFQAYSEWLFDILDECDKRINYDNYSVEALRTPGHLAERLLNIYIAYLKDTKDYKIKELPTIVFLNTDPAPELKPAFSENNIAITLSADDSYVPYVATVLASIRDNSSGKNNYDILIMNKNITPVNQRRLKTLFAEHKNFSLRFIDISRYEERFKNLFLRGHFTIETWFRLLMPELLPHYNKVLYLDSDLVVDHDVAELYKTDIQGYLLAACHDADTAGLYNGFEPNKKHYMDKVLKIEQPYDYFQAGVILFNLAEFRKTYTTDEMLKFASSYDWELLDQDVLNYLAQGKVKFVDMSWNVMFDWRFIRILEIISLAPKELRDAYLEAHEHPKIIHYAGPDKPWHDPNTDYAEIFWKYAKQSGYYEQIIKNMCDRAQPQPRGLKSVAKAGIRKVLPVGTKRRAVIEKAYRRIRR